MGFEGEGTRVTGRGAAESAFRAPGLVFEGWGGGVAAGDDVGEEVEEFFGVEDVDEAGGHHGDGLGFDVGDFGVFEGEEGRGGEGVGHDFEFAALLEDDAAEEGAAVFFGDEVGVVLV